MLCSLLSQLVHGYQQLGLDIEQTCDLASFFEGAPENDNVEYRLQGLMEHDPVMLCGFLKFMIAGLPPGWPVSIIIDGLSWYEDDKDISDTANVIGELYDIYEDLVSTTKIVKILLTRRSMEMPIVQKLSRTHGIDLADHVESSASAIDVPSEIADA